MSAALQRVVELARVVLQVDGIAGRPEGCDGHLVSVSDYGVVLEPGGESSPWKVLLCEAGSPILTGEGATLDDAVADLRAKVEAVADAVTQAIGARLVALREAA